MRTTQTTQIDGHFHTSDRRVGIRYRRFTPFLGTKFVEAVFALVRAVRLDAQVTKETWLENYVRIAEKALAALCKFVAEFPDSYPPDISQLSNQHWQAFGLWYRSIILARDLSPKSKSKILFCTEKFFLSLTRERIINCVIEFPQVAARKLAKDGQSKASKQTKPIRRRTIGHTDSPVAFYVEKHRRSYDYSHYLHVAPHLLPILMQPLAVLYNRASPGRGKALHQCFVNFLKYLAEQKSTWSNEAFYSVLASPNFESISSVAWEAKIYDWRESVRESHGAKVARKQNTNHSIVMKLNTIWQSLAAAGVVPDLVIRGFKGGKRLELITPRATLAQLTTRLLDPTTEAAIWAKLSRNFSETKKEEALQFIRSICAGTAELENLGDVNVLIDRIQQLNIDRLAQIRHCAESDFLAWHDHWCLGQQALKEARIQPADIVDLVDSPLRSAFDRNRNSGRLFFAKSDRTTLGNCLSYIVAAEGGRVMRQHGRLHHIVRKFGGSECFHGYLNAHPHATTALWILILIDTGASAEVVREMPWDCLKPGTLPGYCRLTLGSKMRSGGKIICDEQPEAQTAGARLSCVAAIRLYKKMAVRDHLAADPEHRDSLLLHSYRESIHTLNEDTGRRWFTRFLSRHVQLRGLQATPTTIRPSVLMMHQHTNNDRIEVAQVIADHKRSETTFRHYTGRVPTILRYNVLIRQFQDRYQSIVIASIDDAAAKLGLTEEEHRRIFSDAARTGLGVACLDPKAGAAPGMEVGQHCTRQESCSECEMRWVVATKENIADLLLFSEHLHASQAKFTRANSSLWEARWLPWIVFADIALAKLRQGQTARAFSDAVQLADILRPTYVALPLE